MKKIIIYYIALLINSPCHAQESVMHPVDEYPSYITGDLYVNDFVALHMVYPEKSLNEKKEGKVVISFLCTENAEVKNELISAHLNEELDKEALRLFKLMRFRPAILKGKHIDFEHSVTIQFSIKKYKKQIKTRDSNAPDCLNPKCDTSLTITHKIDKIARYSYGKDSLANFISNELDYPENAKNLGIEGQVLLKFVIETDGRVSNIEVLNSVGGGCVEEAIRVLQKTCWVPALQNGIYVRSEAQMPFDFRLTNSYKDNSMGTQRNSGQ